MPGIVGLFTRLPRQVAEPMLLRMVESLRHESFYVTRTWIDEELGVYVGTVAREGSFSADMPVCDERRETVLIFSGEEYSGPAISGNRSRSASGIYSNGTIRTVHFRQVLTAAFRGC